MPQPSLLSSSTDPTGLMSLLSPVVTGGAPLPQAPPDADPATVAAIQQRAAATATPGWLAFAQSMASQGPRYGPPPALGASLANAMGAGYGASLQASQLPILQESAGLTLQQRQLEFAQQQFEFQREKDMWGAFGGGIMMSPGAGATAGVSATGPPPAAGAAGGSGIGPPATTAQLAALPEIAAIADPAMRLRMIQTAADQGYSLPAAAQWARQINVESGGNQIDPKTGKVIVNASGATGVGQVMPDTFAAMKKAHPDIAGDINDPASNLKASAYYFNEGLTLANGSLPGAAVYYNAGPDGLASYQKTGQPPGPQTADYLVRTGAVAQAPAPPGGGYGGGTNPLGPMVQTKFGLLPQAIAEQANTAFMAAAAKGDIGGAIAAANDVIGKWRQGQVYQVAPGVQRVAGTGQEEAAPVSPTTRVLSPAEAAAKYPNVPPDTTVIETTDSTGKMTPSFMGGARGAQIEYQRYDTQNSNITNSDIYKGYNISNVRADSVLAGLSAGNRAGDMQALDSLAKVYDPQGAVTEAKAEMMSQLGGYDQNLQNLVSKLYGGTVSELTPETRQEIADITVNEMKLREGQLGDFINMTRRNFAGSAPGSDPMRIMPKWQPNWITKNDPQELPDDSAPALGVTTGTGANGQPTWVRTPRPRAGAPTTTGPTTTGPTTTGPTTTGPTTTAPTTTGPTTTGPTTTGPTTTGPTTTGPTTTGPTPRQPQRQQPPDRLAGTNLDGLSAAGLAAIGDDIGRNPDKYSDADKQRYITAAQNAARRALGRR